MKKVIVISPHFPPINGADMHRVRQSVWYYEKFGWQPTVVCVDTIYVEANQDPLLNSSVPIGLEIKKVKAFSTKWTRKIGLGALALRSIWFYFITVNKLLINNNFDLIFFSTTQFPVLTLGRYWKKRFKIPYVIDMQDPWHSTYYKNKPKAERPPKYWFSYILNKCLEPIAMNGCDGLISVSEDYNIQLKERYITLKYKPSVVITFGAFERDIEIANSVIDSDPNYYKHPLKYIVNVGRGGYDLQPALILIFESFKKGLRENPSIFSNFRFKFIGTSYAPNGKGIKTIEPIAVKMGIGDYVEETTDRIPYFMGLHKLLNADILFIPGSNDPSYTASKLYPYILSKKPILGIFHENSSAKLILEKSGAGNVCTLNCSIDTIYSKLSEILTNSYNNKFVCSTDWMYFKKFSAELMTKKQVDLFKYVVN